MEEQQKMKIAKKVKNEKLAKGLVSLIGKTTKHPNKEEEVRIKQK
jgi:hypothetical protein